LARLADGAMVHPDDDVAPAFTGITDADRRTIGREHHQRAGGIEADALHGLRPDRRFRDRRANGGNAGAPDVGRGLFDNVARLVPGRDGVPVCAEQSSRLVEHAGARGCSPNVDADKGLSHAPSRRGPRLPLVRAQAYQHVYPPSTTTMLPVIRLAASEA